MTDLLLMEESGATENNRPTSLLLPVGTPSLSADGELGKQQQKQQQQQRDNHQSRRSGGGPPTCHRSSSSPSLWGSAGFVVLGGSPERPSLKAASQVSPPLSSPTKARTMDRTRKLAKSYGDRYVLMKERNPPFHHVASVWSVPTRQLRWTLYLKCYRFIPNRTQRSLADEFDRHCALITGISSPSPSPSSSPSRNGSSSPSKGALAILGQCNALNFTPSSLIIASTPSQCYLPMSKCYVASY